MQGAGFRCRVQVQGARCKVQGARCRVQVQGAGLGIESGLVLVHTVRRFAEMYIGSWSFSRKTNFGVSFKPNLIHV